MKKKNLAFTLAEVLIVIGIIGVVAALTLPNLNHATGDKETVTRLQKAYSILNEANDRAVAIYGPISTWPEECKTDLNTCWMKRIGEFLKISESCDESVEADDTSYVNCNTKGEMSYDKMIYKLPDEIIFAADNFMDECGDHEPLGINGIIKDMCIESIHVDVNGPNKGKNKRGQDIFIFEVSDTLGVFAKAEGNTIEERIESCVRDKNYNCTFWPLEFGNLDYLKADSTGKCNDSNIILDGVTNTSCH